MDDAQQDEIAARFEEVARILRDLNVDQLWAEATNESDARSSRR